jgi:hypothetical protein
LRQKVFQQTLDNVVISSDANNQSVPEPSTILGIVTLGLGALLSKKHKQDDNNDD